jgi:uncharacterized membrane protein YfcA
MESPTYEQERQFIVMIATLAAIPAVASGVAVGSILGLIGGGGSILAVPLLVYFVGVSSPHVAIGTSAVAVAVTALINLALHARNGVVKWRCAGVFTIAGVFGAFIGASFAKLVDGQLLLALFGALMIAVGIAMIWRRTEQGTGEVRLTRETARKMAPRLAGVGLGVGILSGFFGIGGGFLIVPGLVLATGMPLLAAIGTSLVAVAAFGATTAATYNLSGLVDWTLAGLFVAGGLAGGLAGSWMARFLAGRKAALNIVFAAVVAGVGLYVAGRGVLILLG